MTEYSTTINDYRDLIRERVNNYKNHEFIILSENLDEIIEKIEMISIQQIGQLDLITIPCCIQQPFFSHKLTNIELILNEDYIFLFVWAHGESWKEEFNEKLNVMCERMKISYLRRV